LQAQLMPSDEAVW